MPLYNTSNNVSGLVLASGYSAGGTSFTLTAGGSSLPAPPFRITVITAASYQTSAEVLAIYGVTGVSGNVLTISGALENTTDRAFAAGDKVDLRVTAGAIADLNAVAVPFGPAGTSHAPGIVPDPGATAGLNHFLRDDGTWQTPPEVGVSYAHFTTPGAFTYTIPSTATALRLLMLGSGGGGGSGAATSTGTAYGGAGGNGGAAVDVMVDVASFVTANGGSYTVNGSVGAGGTGGAGSTTSAGSAGGAGGTTFFGNYGSVYNYQCLGSNGGPAGGTSATSAHPNNLGVGMFPGSTGGISGSAPNYQATLCTNGGAGGGGGGNLTGGTTASIGGQGGYPSGVSGIYTQGAAGAVSGGAGGAGAASGLLIGGGGGGGGGANASGNGGVGGVGGGYGGGGGGGGSCPSGSTSGAGGNGAPAAVFIWAW